MEGLVPWGASSALLLVLAGCGPMTHDADLDVAASTGTHDASDDAGATSETGAPGDGTAGSEPRLDLAPLPEELGACAFPVPPLCEPQWPANMTIGGGPASAINRGNMPEVWVSDDGRDLPEFTWALRFEIPCPEASPVPDEWRFEVEGEVSVSQAAEFEYTHVGMYRATIDAELHNACAHLQLHAVDVDPVPLEEGAPFYGWPDLLPSGFFGAAVFEG